MNKNVPARFQRGSIHLTEATYRTGFTRESIEQAIKNRLVDAYVCEPGADNNERRSFYINLRSLNRWARTMNLETKTPAERAVSAEADYQRLANSYDNLLTEVAAFGEQLNELVAAHQSDSA